MNWDELICQADDEALQEIIFAVIKRQKQLHPEEELVVLSLPREPAARKKVVDRAAECMMIWNRT